MEVVEEQAASLSAVSTKVVAAEVPPQAAQAAVEVEEVTTVARAEAVVVPRHRMPCDQTGLSPSANACDSRRPLRLCTNTRFTFTVPFTGYGFDNVLLRLFGRKSNERSGATKRKYGICFDEALTAAERKSVLTSFLCGSLHSVASLS